MLATEFTLHHKTHHKAVRTHRDATRLTRRAGIYYYRRRGPLGRPSEIALSLRTRNYREAEWLAESLDGHLHRNMMANMTIDEIRALCRELLERLLEDDRARRVDYRERGRPVFASRHHLEDHDGDILGADKEAYGDDAHFWRDVLAEGDFEAVSETVDEILEGREVTDTERRMLSVGVIEAFIKARELGQARSAGDAFTVLDLEPGAGISLLGPAGILRSSQPVTVSPARDTPPASEVTKGFMESVALNEVRQQTLAQTKASIDLFIKAVGDRPMHTYGGADGQVYWNALRQLPSDHHKLGRGDEKRTIEEVIERGKREGKDVLALRSLQRHKHVLEAFMAYANRQGHADDKVLKITEGWKMPKKRVAANKQRPLWRTVDLQQLFASPIWRGSKSEKRQEEPGSLLIRNWKFWLPLLGLYQGARLEEVCQLRAQDIRCEEGVWIMDIHDRQGNKLKNVQSRRLLPLHPEILRLGFLSNVREAAPQPNDRIFPTLTPTGPDKKLSYYPTRWFGTLRQRLGIPNGADFHSFRHNATSGLVSASVPIPVISLLLGHLTEGGGEAANRYFDLTLAQKRDFLGRLHYPEINLSHLYLSAEECF